jgi:hypothetical protein
MLKTRKTKKKKPQENRLFAIYKTRTTGWAFCHGPDNVIPHDYNLLLRLGGYGLGRHGTMLVIHVGYYFSLSDFVERCFYAWPESRFFCVFAVDACLVLLF